MAIKVKAVERELTVGASAGQFRYIMQADLYNKLSDAKVIQEASLRSGISKGAINAAWDAIGEVIKAWATEGHSVAIPGLGTMRFGVRATSVADVNMVGTDLITSRRVIFTPNSDIKEELRKASINIMTNEFLKIAMEQTGIRQGRNGFENDKKPESTPDSEDAPDEYKPHITDAFGTLWYGMNFYLREYSSSSSGMLFLGTK